jgi:hypothetical protein
MQITTIGLDIDECRVVPWSYQIIPGSTECIAVRTKGACELCLSFSYTATGRFGNTRDHP